MVEANPYQAPQSTIADTDSDEFGEVKVFSFQGRMGRLRYLGYSFGFYLLSVLISSLVAGVAAGAQGGDPGVVASVIPMIIMLVIMPLLFMFTIQRLHDVNLSGWFSLLMLVPFVNFLATIGLMVAPGTKGENNYGLQPPPNSSGVVVMAMIVPLVFVSAILAAVAIPAYQAYVQEARMQMEQQQ
jgi:uncharacterized membrane protein YhaH (DUF805 family)